MGGEPLDSSGRPQATRLLSGDLFGPAFPEWQRRAACAKTGVERFYAEGRGRMMNEAKMVCSSCPVVVECLEFSVAGNEEFGIWGGAGEAERRRFRAARAGRQHGPEVKPGCGCGWCTELEGHLATIRVLRGQSHGERRVLRALVPRRTRRPGPGATHGLRVTYARGCRCEACMWSATQWAQRLARLGCDTGAWWREHGAAASRAEDGVVLCMLAARDTFAGLVSGLCTVAAVDAATSFQAALAAAPSTARRAGAASPDRTDTGRSLTA